MKKAQYADQCLIGVQTCRITERAQAIGNWQLLYKGIRMLIRRMRKQPVTERYTSAAALFTKKNRSAVARLRRILLKQILVHVSS